MLKNSPIGPHVLYDHNFSMLAWLTYMFQQECYPLGFGPPAGCGGLSNTSCICSDIAFAIAIAPCVVATCSLTERSSKSSVLPGSTFSQGGMSHSHHNGTLLIRFVSLISEQGFGDYSLRWTTIRRLSRHSVHQWCRFCIRGRRRLSDAIKPWRSEPTHQLSNVCSKLASLIITPSVCLCLI